MNISLPINEKNRPSGVLQRGRFFPFSLGNRLALCASMVRRGTALTDVGTDHAYLPVWLAKRGFIRSAVAADIRPGPLKRARANILRYGVSDKVSVRLSDGLDQVRPPEAEDLTIAGMGGLMMIRILDRAPWLRKPDRRIILQPMTKAENLRRYLAGSGFFVVREKAAEEDGHIYTVMQVSYRPEERQENEMFYWVGRITSETAEGKKYLEHQKRRLKRRAKGLFTAGSTRQAEYFFSLAAQIEKMLSAGPAE